MSGSSWQTLRRRILIRDEYVCYVCGLPGADEVDHVLAVGEGGAKRDPSNLGAIHADPCHAEKTKRENAARAARRRARRELTSEP